MDNLPHIVPMKGDNTPFDQIKQTVDGEEFWSARDLMPLLGYPRWQDFKPTIERAMVAAKNQNMDVTSLFRIDAKKGTGGRPAEDYRLARFAAYLVAMNGDPRKWEVAAAQAYFAIRTHQAETMKFDPSKLTRSEILLMALNAEHERMELEAANRELTPKAQAWDSLCAADGTYSVGSVAKMVGLSQNKLFDLLRSEEIFISKGAMRNTPYQRYMKYFSVKMYEYDRKDGTKGASYTTRVLPEGIKFLAERLNLQVKEIEHG